MPYITIESGVLSTEQKDALIKRLTEVSSEIMNVPQEFFSVTIKELPDENFGIGGKTIGEIKAEYLRKRNRYTYSWIDRPFARILVPVRSVRKIIPNVANATDEGVLE